MASGEASWSEAFIRQAQSDLDAYELLLKYSGSLSVCHRLHYLQMWLEKLCKAYLWDAGTTKAHLPEFRTSHNVVAKVLPGLIMETWASIGYSSVPNQKELRSICREIDLLHPQVNEGGVRPDNVEYPWATLRDAELLIKVPADETYKIADRVSNYVGKRMIKAATVLTRRPSHLSSGEKS